MLAFFKAAITLRHAHPVLRRGHFSQLYARHAVFAFARHDDAATFVVALNAGEHAAEAMLPVGAYFRDGTSLTTVLMSSGATSSRDRPTVADGQIVLQLPARTGVVLAAAEAEAPGQVTLTATPTDRRPPGFDRLM